MAIMIPPMYNTELPVGNSEPNNSSDVRLIQTLLLEIARVKPGWQPSSQLTADGLHSAALSEWIGAFQSHLRSRGAPLVVDHKIHPMPVKHLIDFSAKFRNGVGSTLFALNFNLREGAKQVHQNLGTNLGIAEQALG